MTEEGRQWLYRIELRLAAMWAAALADGRIAESLDCTQAWLWAQANRMGFHVALIPPGFSEGAKCKSA